MLVLNPYACSHESTALTINEVFQRFFSSQSHSCTEATLTKLLRARGGGGRNEEGEGRGEREARIGCSPRLRFPLSFYSNI